MNIGRIFKKLLLRGFCIDVSGVGVWYMCPSRGCRATNYDIMSYKEQMAEWLSKHQDATLEEAWEAGYMICTNNWCQGKVELMAQCSELMKQIIDK